MRNARNVARNDYTLIAFDQNGNERRDEEGNLGSAKAASRIQQEPVTDVFVMSHGWQGDIPAALAQYNDWTGAMLANTDDLARISALRPGFKPLLAGIHWPSRPWGDEQVIASFALDMDPAADFAQRLGNTPEIRDAVQRVFAATALTVDLNVMPPELEQAYRDLDQALGMGAAGLGGPPGADRQPFDPRAVFAQARDAASGQGVSFGSFSLPSLLEPLRVLSFWKMKDRARIIGEGAGVDLLGTLRQAAGTRPLRFHLMGHSFGCIVVSAMMARFPVQSAVLVQGAMSLWSYSPRGYFKTEQVTGPIVTTISRFDRAVGFFYPLGAGIARQVSFEMPELPLYGGVGSFGLQGIEHITSVASMLPSTEQYNFQPGQIYNIESSNIIKSTSDPIAGAHSDISHPEVGHLLWQAAMPQS
ncbi:MAG: hypothetical protein ACR2NN_24845 [Bryobacteraceae bacterium]